MEQYRGARGGKIDPEEGVLWYGLDTAGSHKDESGNGDLAVAWRHWAS